MPPTEMTVPATEVYLMPTIPAPFKTQQYWSKKAMGYLWSNRDKMDIQTIAYLDQLFKNKCKGTLECYYESTYKIASSWDGFGRYYGSGASLEKLENEIRATLAGKEYTDYDIENCHPTLLTQFAKRYWDFNLSQLQYYVDNRNAILDCFSSRDEGKQAFISIMFGGSTTDERLRPLQQEIFNFTEYLKGLPQFEALLTKCKNHVKNEAKKGIKKSLNGSFLSRLIHTEERRCLDVMIANIKKQGFSPDVYAYDGVMVRNTDRELNISKMEQAVLDSTGYRINIKIKPLEGITIPEDFNCEEDANAIYQEMKARFEENHFYYAETGQFVEVKPDGGLRFMDLKHATELFSAKWNYTIKNEEGQDVKIQFFPEWRKDDSRLIIEQIDIKPSTDPTVFSPPLRLAYKNDSEVTDEQREEIQETFRVFILDLIPNEVERVCLMEWLAQMLQQPFQNPLMAVVMSGKKRCGKDTLGDFICEWLIGKTYSTNYTSTKQYWSEYDTGRTNRLFIKLEEAQGALNIENEADMKARITGKDMSINKKHSDPIVIGNYNRTFFTTNECNAVSMSDGEMRYLAISCSGRLIGKMDYWTNLRRLLFNPVGGKVIGELLESLACGSWPRVPPVTAMAEMMIEDQKTSEQRFIDQWPGDSMSASDLFLLYREYCVENSLPHVKNVKSFGIKLAIMVRDGELLKKIVTSGSIYIKPGLE